MDNGFFLSLFCFVFPKTLLYANALTLILKETKDIVAICYFGL